MSCRLCLFYAVKAKIKGEIIFIGVRCQINLRPSNPIGFLDEFLIPIGPLFQLQYDFLAW
jgi:hypothetical protein